MPSIGTAVSAEYVYDQVRLLSFAPISSTLTFPSPSIVTVTAFGGGPGLKFDFATLSFQVPTNGLSWSPRAARGAADHANINAVSEAIKRYRFIQFSFFRLLLTDDGDYMLFCCLNWDQTAPDSNRHGLGTSGRAELAEDLRHMKFCGVIRDPQLCGNFLVSKSRCKHTENLQFARSEGFHQVMATGRN